MAITQNGIVFNNTSKIGTGTAIKLLKNGAADDMVADIADGIASEEFANNYGAVQSLNINWNGAKLDNVSLPNVLDNNNTINTTGQLLALINDLQEQINAIVYIMNGGNTGGNTGGSTGGSSVTPTPTPTPTPPPSSTTTTVSPTGTQTRTPL